MAGEERLPHVCRTDEELVSAVDIGLVPVNLDEQVAAVGGMGQYIHNRVALMVTKWQLNDLQVEIGENQQYRGSGSKQAVEVKKGEEVITRFKVNTGLDESTGEARVGAIFFDDYAITMQLVEAIISRTTPGENREAGVAFLARLVLREQMAAEPEKQKWQRAVGYMTGHTDELVKETKKLMKTSVGRKFLGVDKKGQSLGMGDREGIWERLVLERMGPEEEEIWKGKEKWMIK